MQQAQPVAQVHPFPCAADVGFDNRGVEFLEILRGQPGQGNVPRAGTEGGSNSGVVTLH